MDRSSLECLDKLTSLRNELRTRSTIVALCAVIHLLSILAHRPNDKIAFLPHANNSEYLTFSAFCTVYLGCLLRLKYEEKKNIYIYKIRFFT